MSWRRVKLARLRRAAELLRLLVIGVWVVLVILRRLLLRLVLELIAKLAHLRLLLRWR